MRCCSTLTGSPDEADELDAVDDSILTIWRRELEAARARAASLVDLADAAEELPSRWVLTENAVVWRIETGLVAEPDVDVEDVGVAFVVRVRRGGALPPARAVIPLPSAPRITAISVEFRGEGVELRLLLESL